MSNNSSNNIVGNIIGSICALLLALLLGSYAYTLSSLDSEQKEKREWRRWHQEELDKKFDDIKRGQDKLFEYVNRNYEVVNKDNDYIKDLLRQILNEEIKKINQSQRRK